MEREQQMENYVKDTEEFYRLAARITADSKEMIELFCNRVASDPNHLLSGTFIVVSKDIREIAKYNMSILCHATAMMNTAKNEEARENWCQWSNVEKFEFFVRMGKQAEMK